MTAPIVLFAYNRPAHTRRTVEALQANRLAGESDLIIFADGLKHGANADDVSSVRTFLRTVTGFRSVRLHERAANAGLAASIIEGVTSVCSEYGRAIVLEDDLVSSRWFLDYMNRALDLYEGDDEVASIHGYCYPVKERLPATFFLRGADCWGWATWSRAWRQFEPDGSRLLQALLDRGLQREFDMDGAFPFTEMLRQQIAGKNNSWAVRWHAACFLNSKLTLYPGESYIRNIGNDSSGTHCASSDEYETPLAERPIDLHRIDLVPSQAARREIARFMRGTNHGLVSRVAARLTRTLRSLM
jgi:hypothetical protein